VIQGVLGGLYCRLNDEELAEHGEAERDKEGLRRELRQVIEEPSSMRRQQRA
jgi:hypothetical protein